MSSAEDLILKTDLDDFDYPVFITQEREIYVKKRPSKSKTIIATFYVKDVKSIEKTTDIKHELLEKSLTIIRDVTKEDAEKIERIEITYEVYIGDREKLIGEVKAYIIVIASQLTPFSGGKFERARAWAIGFDWKKRIIARIPQLEKYIVVKGKEWGKGRANVRVCIKLPIVTDELNKYFNIVLSSSTVSQVSQLDLEKQIEQIEKLIKQKEQELETLKEQLQQLRLKLQLEQMKQKVV